MRGGKESHSTNLYLSLLLLVALALRITFFTEDRFHADEALYAGWALRILDDDPLLLDVPVDKPPLLLYALAASMRLFGRSEAAARLPSLGASILGIALTYRLGHRLYDRRTGLWAALLLCLSPFDILFARTAFTDTTLVLWTLAALLAAASGRSFWAGLAVGLALATKQHAVTLIPLVFLVGIIAQPFPLPRKKDPRSSLSLPLRPRVLAPLRLVFPLRAALQYLLGSALPFALVTWWDSARWDIRPGYWQQSSLSYGGLVWADPVTWGTRLVEWGTWARYLVGSPLLYALLLLGSVVLVLHGWASAHRRPGLWHFDALWLLYSLGYVALHTVFRFSIWDRYLLPLAPLVALLLARIAVRGLAQARPARWLRLLCAAVVCLVACFSACRAALNGYPVGGEHWAYQGLDRIVAYLVENAAPDAVIYHHWLRWHYTYYLYDTGFELRWWQSPEHLRQEASRTPGREQYIVLPDWRTLDPASEGIALLPLTQTTRRDGSTSLQLCRVYVR